jgi:uncharacterized protein YigA (DUF484 family)
MATPPASAANARLDRAATETSLRELRAWCTRLEELAAELGIVTGGSSQLISLLQLQLAAALAANVALTARITSLEASAASQKATINALLDWQVTATASLPPGFRPSQPLPGHV